MLPNVMLREIMLKTMERSSVFIPIHPEMKLKDVERIVNEQGWSHIIITTKEGSFVGVMRVEELRRTIDSEFPELYELSVEEWLLPFNHDAHRGVIDVSGDTRLNEVIHLFENPSANVIPIIEEGKLEGIVTHVQVLEAIDAYLDDYHKRDDV
jgi:CBS domain-containing protein